MALGDAAPGQLRVDPVQTVPEPSRRSEVHHRSQGRWVERLGVGGLGQGVGEEETTWPQLWAIPSPAMRPPPSTNTKYGEPGTS